MRGDRRRGELRGVDALRTRPACCASAARRACTLMPAQLMWRLHVEAVTRIADVLLPGDGGAGHGRVVLVGSRVAQGKAGRSQYAATKAAPDRPGTQLGGRGGGPASRSTSSRRPPQTAMLDDPARQSERRCCRRSAA
jgi:hypothetical protein